MTPDIVTTVSSSGYRASTASRADATVALSVFGNGKTRANAAWNGLGTDYLRRLADAGFP